MKQNLLEMIKLLFGFILMSLFHTDEIGRQNRSSGTKTELSRRAGATTYCPGKPRNAGVIGHIN